jgi:mucin-19
VVVTGDAVELKSATIDASGADGGGTVNIGGGFQGGDDSIANSQSTVVDAGSVITANATDSGDGGTVVLWSDGNTSFDGQIFAQGAPLGSGGMVEVSGKQTLNFAGTVDTGGGHLLLDPFSYIVGLTEAGNIVAALASNNVTIQTSADDATQGSSGVNTDPGDITVNASIFYDSLFDLTFLAHQNINFNASVQNHNDTGGDVNVVAGWDGTSAFDATTFAAADVTSTTLFGNSNGSVFIGDGTQASGVAVGSRRGNTNMFAHDVTLQGGTGGDGHGRFAQLGFQITNGRALGGFDLDLTATGGANVTVDGGITIHTVNDITATGGNGSSYNYAQIGHVGAARSSDTTRIEAVADSLIELTAAGDLTFAGGSGISAYAQLGQGGLFANGDHSGETTLNVAGNLKFEGGSGSNSYAQLGQGGGRANGDHSGTTTLDVKGNVFFSGGDGVGSYAHLGQGGAFVRGSLSGSTVLNVEGNVTFSGGRGVRSYAQLGQGGLGAHGSHSGTTTLEVEGDIMFVGGLDGDDDNGVGGGGGDVGGGDDGGGGGGDDGGGSGGGGDDGGGSGGGGSGGGGDDGGGSGGGDDGGGGGSDEDSGGDDRDPVFVEVGSPEYGSNYAQLGHGGFWADGSFTGTIDVTASGNLIVAGLNATNINAIIGHGDETDSDSGDTVSGDVLLRISGNASLTNAFIGHQIDADGTYTSGNTYFGVLGNLAANAASQLNSAPGGSPNGELRIYLGGDDDVDAITQLNGTFHGVTDFPNDHGRHVFGTGPYAPVTGNFAYYHLDPSRSDNFGNAPQGFINGIFTTYDEFIRYVDFFATVQSLLNPTGPPATNNPATTESNEENTSPDSVQPEGDNNNPQGDEIIIPEIRVTGV